MAGIIAETNHVLTGMNEHQPENPGAPPMRPFPTLELEVISASESPTRGNPVQQKQISSSQLLMLAGAAFLLIYLTKK